MVVFMSEKPLQLPIIFTAKIWKWGLKRNRFIIRLPKEYRETLEKWYKDKEELYVLILPLSELTRQQVIVRTIEK